MKNYLIGLGLVLVTVLVTLWATNDYEEFSSSNDAMKALTQSGSVTVVQDTLVYTLMGDHLTYTELNALKYMSDDFYSVRVCNLETKYFQQQFIECTTGEVAPYSEGVVEDEVRKNDLERSGE